MDNLAVTLTYDDYTVGWICALRKEMVAAEAMLDEVHKGLPMQPIDSNIYKLGRVGQHNVVIACLAEYGTVSAAKTATMMKFSFPLIRFGLMVGIGGGIPSKKIDIRLGDIVVSAPTGKDPGVIQFELGKVEKGGEFHRKGTLNKPPTILLNAVNLLREKYDLNENISNHITRGFNKWFPKWARKYEYLSATDDRLFQADYDHVDFNDTCEDCDDLKVVLREPREDHHPVIHYGNIASGNKVLKDGLTRDLLAEEEHVICFEMEAAGLMDDFKCLVIRGICDYSDSHKNKAWQPYAAVVAAAYAKELLLEIPTETIKKMEPIKKNFHWLVPRPVSSFFTGRKQILETLHEIFCTPSRETKEALQKRFVIYGIGGSGKSEVCLKFAEANRENFWGIFWVDGSSIMSLERSFVDIATACGVPTKSFTDAKRWLENTDHIWLIIMDNADDQKIDYTKYFPSGNRGNILMTTRLPQCSIHQNVGSESFEKLEYDDAVTLLLKASGFEDSQWQNQRNDAKEVVGILSQHALALTQAGAFIKEGLCNMKEYPREFERQRERLLKYRPVQAASTYGDVYATFEVSAQVLEASSDRSSSDALELLSFLAHVYFQDVPEEMFTKAWTHSSELLDWGDDDDNTNIWYLSKWHVSHLPNFLRQTNSKELDIISLRLAVSVLRSFSIITVHAKTGNVSMHPLAHVWARDRLNSVDQAATWLTTSATLALSIGDLSYQEFWRKLQAHIEFCLDIQHDDCFRMHAALEIGRISYHFAQLLIWMGNYARAKGSYTFMLQKLREEISVPLTTIFLLENQIAFCFDRLGEHKEAILLLERTIQSCRGTLQPTDSILLELKHTLAEAYQHTNQHEKSIELEREIFQWRKKTLKPTDPNLLASQHQLASAYIEIKQYQEAVELLQEVVEIRKTALEPTHPDRLISQHELARAYIGIKQYPEAVELLQEVVQIDARTLEPTHPDRLGSEHLLSRCYFVLREEEEAHRDPSLSSLSGTLALDDVKRVIAQGPADDLPTTPEFDLDTSFVAEGDALPPIGPRRKNRDIVLSVFRKKHR